MIEYLRNITVPAAKLILKNTADSIAEQCDKIMKNDGRVVIDIEKRLDEKVKELTELVRKKKIVVDEYEKSAAAVKGIEDEQLRLTSEMKRLRKDYQDYGIAEAKAKRGDDKARDDMKRLEKNHDQYVEDEKKVSDLERQKEPLVRELAKASGQLKDVEKGYGRSKRDSYNHWLLMVQKKVKALEELKESSSRLVSRDMKYNKERFVKVFTNPAEVNEIVKTIEAALVGITKGKFGSVSKALQERYFESTLNTLTPKDYIYLPFEHISEKEKCRKVYEIDGKTYIIYDLNELPESAIRKGFYVILSFALQTVGAPFMDRMFFESKNLESYVENSKEEADTDKKRSSFSVTENGMFTRPEEKVEKTSDNTELTALWKSIKTTISSPDEIDDMAETVFGSVMDQVPKDSYYRNITKDKAMSEFKSLLRGVVQSYSTTIESGKEIKSSSIQNLIINEEHKKIVATIVACVINMKILELLEDIFVDNIRKERREKEPWEENFLKNLGQKYKTLDRGLSNYKLVRAYKRAMVNASSRRLTRLAMKFFEEGFEEPEDAASKLLREKRDY